ncbi:MAG: SWIM zinc finger family protein, partial [Treponema sp.]|nr:SWIM zinc finger family protein [Treponema sp.]
MKSRYGVTPWGRWFIDILDSYQMGARLDRGRTYANTGRVLSLGFAAGKVIAKVEGNYRPFYHVEISFPPLKKAEQVYRMIEEDASLLARIAAGELPETFLQKLKDKGINLIPRRWRDMKRSCTCPDDGDPCKHMAALYYIIAREIDSDPHILFRLRGMDLAERFGKAAIHQIMSPFAVTYAAKKAQAKKEPPELEEIPHAGELIGALLPPMPPFCERDFAVVMAEFYHFCAGYQAWEPALENTDEKNSPDTEHDFSRSTWTIVCHNPCPGAEVMLEAKDINDKKKRYSLYNAFEHFVCFSSDDGTASYSFFFYLFKFLNLVCSSCAFIPYVLAEYETLQIIWRPFETLPPVPAMLAALASHECGILTIKDRQKRAENRTVSGRSVVDLLTSAFLNEWIKRKYFILKEKLRRGNWQTGGSEYHELLNLFFAGTSIDVSSPARRSTPAAIDRWLSVLQIDFSAYRYSLTVKELNKEATSFEAWDFALSMDVLIEQEDEVKKIPLSKCKDLEILRAPIALSNYLPEIRELASPSKLAVSLSEERLTAFLDSSAPLLARLGLKINLPKALARELKPRLVIKGKPTGGSLVHYLNLDALHDFEWQVAIGDEVLSLKEFEKLVKQKRAMVRFRDGFVKMDAEEFARLLKKAKIAAPDFNDFLKAHFSGDTVLAFDARETINAIFREQEFPVPQSLTGQLRPYQKRGYNWVCSLLLSGFGCILADDMGLGKTIQSIAALLRLKEEGLLGSGCLVIAPAALLSNWEKELSRFAPSLGVTRYHGSRRVLDRKQDVYLTTYQTAVRDAEKLKGESFSLLLVDEAHLVKNAETR